MLLSVGPENMSEDENAIGKGYKREVVAYGILIAVLYGVAYYADIKWVVATGFAAVIILLHGLSGRLFDLCIRLRRTNILLNQKNSD